MNEVDFNVLETEFPDKWKYLTKNLAYPYENFNSIDEYQKPVDNLRKEEFFIKLKIKCPDHECIERAKKRLIKNSILKMETK